MKLKDKIKSYSFWVSIASAVILILKVLGSRFGFVVDESMVSDIFTALCSILVLMGIIVVPSQQDTSAQIKLSKTKTPLNNQSKVFQEKQNDDLKTNNENLTYNNLDEQMQEDENQNCDSQMIDFESQNNSKNKQENLQTTTMEIAQITQDTIQETTQGKANDTQTSFQTNNQSFDETNSQVSTQSLDEVETQPIIEANSQVSTQPLDEVETQPIVEANSQVSTQSLDETETHSLDESATQTNEESVIQTFNQNKETSSSIGDDNNNKLDSEESKTNENFDNILNLKNLFNSEREKFANNINDYILELQEEIRKTRERM